MVFVDTSAWYARLVPNDPDHRAALRWASENQVPFLTTDYIIDETLTLLLVRGQKACAIKLGEALFNASLATIHYVTTEEILLAWRVFRDYQDKAWSFTDASSKVVMERLSVRKAFTFDPHFRQFGSVQVVP
jgi:hypothetical protein